MSLFLALYIESSGTSIASMSAPDHEDQIRDDEQPEDDGERFDMVSPGRRAGEAAPDPLEGTARHLGCQARAFRPLGR